MSIHAPAPLRTLAASSLPPRVRAILERLLVVVDDGVGSMVDRLLMDFELELQRQAASAVPALQGRYEGLVRTVQRGGIVLRPRVHAQVEDAFARLREPPVREAPAAPAIPDFSSLQLMHEQEVDERAALKMITTRQEARSALPLLLLGQRFGVLAGAPAFDAERLPVGPWQLGRMIVDASRALHVDAQASLLLLRFLDQQLIGHYATLLEAMNARLVADGVLPELSFVPVRKTPRLQNRDAELAAAEDVLPQVERRTQARRAGDRADAGHGGTGGRRAGDRPERSFTAWIGEAVDPVGEELQREAFEQLRTLLVGRRELLGKLRSAAHAPGAASAPAPSVDSALQQLQAQVAEGTAQSPSDPLALGRALEAHPARGGQDAFELLAMLYRQIHREVQPGSASHELLNRLVVPILRVCTQDPRFFFDARHPARVLLGAVAEAGAAWLGTDEIDPAYEAQLRDAVHHVLTFFDGDLRVFEEANRWVEAAAATLARKAEVSERRFVEAARGKEKLELAKRRAQSALDEALDGRAVPRFTRALLCQAWADVLTLVWLRHGEGSPEWAEHLATTRAIVAAAAGAGRPPPAAGIEQALMLVGHHGEDAALIARHLLGLAETEDDDAAATRTELAMRIKSRTRLGAEARRAQDGAPPTPAESAARERLLALPFGSWLEETDADGRVSRRRLAWFSAETDQALFVNQRGQRVAETTLAAIARDLAAGRLQVVDAGRGRVVDRAWQAALAGLVHFGAGAEPRP